jgi:EryCIII-like glycosyltransferase
VILNAHLHVAFLHEEGAHGLVALPLAEHQVDVGLTACPEDLYPQKARRLSRQPDHLLQVLLVSVYPVGVDLEEVPHDWLFERVGVAVHHGGAGTTAASLRAGVPTVVVPFFADQPFWGWRVAELGVGPEPIPRRSLTVEQLANAIQQTTADRDMNSRAIALSRRIRGENGIERAVEAFSLYTRKVG